MIEKKYKQKRLEELRSEVKDFHPILELLLPLLENVDHVEYTHGPNEMGADFIIHKRDTTLSSTKYIGVIVKVGDMKQQHIPELERQVDECKESRIISSGTKKVHLNEIWIFTTGKITNNTKERIYSKFSNLSVEFIPQDKLISFIDKYIPYIWHDVPNKIGKYLQNLWLENKAKDISSSLVNLSDERFYIELDLYEKHSGFENNKRRKNIDIYELIEKEKSIFIEADMGFGKSKLIRDIINTYSTAHKFYESKTLPIHCEFSDFYKTHEKRIESIIKHTVESNEIEDNGEINYLILIDALDEINTDDESLYVDIISKNLDYIESNENVKVIFTSRPLRSIEESKLFDRLKYLGIKSISTRKLIKFLEKICTSLNLSTRLIEDVKSSQLFKQIPQNPIAAILISKLLSENSRELPSNVTELYSQALELMLGRWDIDKGLTTLKEYEASDNICCDIGKYIIENSLPMMSINEAKDMFRNYLNKRNLDISHEKLFEKTINRSGVFIVNKDHNTILFKHRSFAEYFCAKKMFKTHRNILDERVFSPYWSNTFFFYIGLLRDCPELLSEIFNFPVNNISEKWQKLINIPHYLLAGYSSPYDIVENNLYKLLIEYTKFYLEILDNKIDSNLSYFPEVTVLWIFRLIVTENLSYEYFRKAIENVPLQISDTIEEDAVKQYAIFFTGTVCLHLNDKEPFNYLLETYKIEELPPAMNIGLISEMRTHEALGKLPLMKRHKKNFKRLTKGKNISNILNTIQEKPVIKRKK